MSSAVSITEASAVCCQSATRPANGTRALAGETYAGADPRQPRPGACAAGVAPGHRDRAQHAGERILERQLEGLVEVGTTLGGARLFAPRRENLGEQIAERGGVFCAPRGEIEPLEAASAAFAPAGWRSRVVPHAALGIHQRLVRLEDLAKPPCGHLD